MRRFAALVAVAVLAAQARAQVPLPPAIDPGAIQQRQIEEERRRQELERLQRKPVPDPLKKPEADKPPVKAAPDAARFMVREIEFTASEILSKEELEAIARDYRGKDLSLADLQELAGRVNELYRAKNVVTARATIPPQDVTGGIVQVRLVEGHLGEIRVEGNANTSADYVRWRLGLKPETLVDLGRLEEELIRFNRTTDAQLRAELKPGQSFGLTDLNLTLAEPPRQVLSLFTDNAGSKSTGETRVGATYLNRSVLGFRDDFTLSTNYSDGHEGYSVSYGVPVTRSGGRATLAYYKDYTEVRHGPLAVLDLTGESEATILSLRQPLYTTSRAQFDLTGGAKERITTNWISGVFLQSTKTRDGNLGGELQAADASGFWLASYAVSSGHATVAATDRNYTIGRGSLRRVQELGGGLSVRGFLSFQHTGDRLLPSSEQFVIGGDGSVRGYPVGSFAGDQGYTASVELHHPLIHGGSAEENGFSATGFFFLDYGYVKPFRPPDSTLRPYENLSSVGWGVNAYLQKHVYARVTAAYAMNDLPLEPRRYEIHFQLIASIF